MEWHFGLDGETLDIDSIAELVRDHVTFHKDNSGRSYLVMHLDFDPADWVLAKGAAEKQLAHLNAVGRITSRNHKNVQIGGVSCKSADGSSTLFVTVTDTVRVRLRGAAVVEVLDDAGDAIARPTRKQIGDLFLEAAREDPHLARALDLFGTLSLNWRVLYMVLEAAEDAYGGERGLIAKNWAGPGEIKNFKDTANSYNAIQSEARHGSTTKGTSSPKITLEAATTMVRTILERWARSLVT